MIIIYLWPSKTVNHISMGLYGLGHSSRYISYFPGNGNKSGFKLHDLQSDLVLYKNYPPIHLIIPTEEDNIKFGLNESRIQEKWDAMTNIPEFNILNQNCARMVFDCIQPALTEWSRKHSIELPMAPTSLSSAEETFQYYKRFKQLVINNYLKTDNKMSGPADTIELIAAPQSGSIAVDANQLKSTFFASPDKIKKLNHVQQYGHSLANTADCQDTIHKAYYVKIQTAQSTAGIHTNLRF